MQCFMIGALVLAALGQSSIPPPPAWSPVLDCQHRVYAVDSLICDDAALLASSREIEQAYERNARSAEPERMVELRASQERWSKQRNMCVFEETANRCVKRLQDKRLRYLSGG